MIVFTRLAYQYRYIMKMKLAMRITSHTGE